MDRWIHKSPVWDIGTHHLISGFTNSYFFKTQANFSISLRLFSLILEAAVLKLSQVPTSFHSLWCHETIWLGDAKTILPESPRIQRTLIMEETRKLIGFWPCLGVLVFLQGTIARHGPAAMSKDKPEARLKTFKGEEERSTLKRVAGRMFSLVAKVEMLHSHIRVTGF